jgi:hypothetical protein
LVVAQVNIYQKILCSQFTFAYCEKVRSMKGRARHAYDMVVQGSGYRGADTGVAKYRLIASARSACVDRQFRERRYIFEQGAALEK